MFEPDTKVKVIAADDVFKSFIGQVGQAGPVSKTDPNRQMVKFTAGSGLYFDLAQLEAQ